MRQVHSSHNKNNDILPDKEIPRTIDIPSRVAVSSPSVFSQSQADDDEDLDPLLSSYGSIDVPRRKLFPASSSLASSSEAFRRVEAQRVWRSKAVIYLCVLVSDMCRGILFPTLWLLVYSLGGDKTAQGVVVASFSAGRILSSPYFGELTERRGYRQALVVCNAIIILGAFLYIVASRVEMVILAQFVIGVGAGSLGATRSYIAEQATKQTRTQELALLTSLQYAGFAVTPILGAVISSQCTGSARFAMPAISIAAAAAVCVLLLCTVFRDVERSLAPLEVSEPIEHDDYTERERDEGKELLEEERRLFSTPTSSSFQNHGFSYWTLSTAGCLMNFVTKGTIAIFETLTAMFVIKYLHWDTMRLGVTISVCGLVGVFFLLSFPLLMRLIEDTDLIIGGVALMVVSCFSLMQFGFGGVSEQAVYAALVLMFAVGYPVGHTALIGVFSKLSSSGPQGKMLGIFGSVGSLARILFPVCSAGLAQRFGFDFAFGFAAVMLTVSLVFMIYFRSVMISVAHE